MYNAISASCYKAHAASFNLKISGNTPDDSS